MKSKFVFLLKLSVIGSLFLMLFTTGCASTSNIKTWNEGKFVRLNNNPIIYPDMLGLEGKLGENINGPSVIKVPKWVENPLGKYYMYFAHHHGKYIRLAYANSPIGPWTIYKPGVLKIEQTGATGHIASPDVVINEANKTIRLYFHGYPEDKAIGQKTFLSTSKNGLDFTAYDTVLGPSYFRTFNYKNNFYALVSGAFYKSEDGIKPYKKGALVLPKIRHSAVVVEGDYLVIFYSQKGDEPERILKTTVNLSEGSYKDWKASEVQEILKPEMDYEGAELPIKKSVNGFARTRVHELRDPAILIDNKTIYLYYSVAGESGIAVSKLVKK
ncbi:glycoside hydrolase family protein [Formosa algae]|uniref:hypothetical protein n=1 Tax=Formosa algae TaxID=225843 RepID=UPI001C0EE967|nr:hypothetical protein [Formosa algae]